MKILVAGAGGFIGGHLVKRLLNQGYEVKAADIKPKGDWWQQFKKAQNLDKLDLRYQQNCKKAVKGCSEVFNLACNMGGIGFIENHKTDCMFSVLINCHLLNEAYKQNVMKYLYTSSACVYPVHLQQDNNVTALKESDAYPADPEDGYGWEKLYSERFCQKFSDEYGMTTRIVRLHNVFGEHGSWKGGREKVPAAFCRKIASAGPNGKIDIWGDGEQTRSFMYIDDCVEGIMKIMNSVVDFPINLGSEHLIKINDLATIIENIAGYKVQREYILDAPKGVRGRNSDNKLVRKYLGWEPSNDIERGLANTYKWIKEKVDQG